MSAPDLIQQQRQILRDLCELANWHTKGPVSVNPEKRVQVAS